MSWAGRCARWSCRVEPRDYADVAAALECYSPAQLIGFARRLDPGLTGEDFAYAGLELDQMDDRAFAELGLSQHQVATLRERFSAWPRDARTASHEGHLGNPAQHRPGHTSGHPQPAGLNQARMIHTQPADDSTGLGTNPSRKPDGTTRKPSHPGARLPVT